MKCKHCGSSKITCYKTINSKTIFVCTKCGLGFLIDSSLKKLKLDYLYSFTEYKKNLDLIKNRSKLLIPSIVKQKTSGKLLEIGAGFGLLSSLLLKQGDYTLDVVEPSLTPEYLKKTKYTLHKENLDQFLKTNKKKFDIIVMMDVIEHLEDPFKSLDRLRGLLNDKGVLVVQTPNYRSLMQYIVKDWSWWMVEDHKWFFSSESFKNTLKKHGFRILQYRTYEDWLDFRKNLDGNFADLRQPLRKAVKGLFFALFYPFYLLFHPLLWKLGYGGLIFSIVQKDG